jgi:chromosome condensin MukBEF ATPase and DNA-binding subunit MukB
MFKRTAGQKEANEIALQERTHAFNARQEAYRAALEAADAQGKKSPEYAELEAARVESEHARESRRAALAAIDEQIAQLRKQRGQVEVEHEPVMQAAKVRRDTAWATHDGLAQRLTEEVQARYRDLVGCWDQGQWQRPAGA